MSLTQAEVTAALTAGTDRKIPAGNSLYLWVRGGRGYWVFHYREGRSLKSKGLGSAATVSPVAARKAREAFEVGRRAILPATPPSQSRGAPASDSFGKAVATYLTHHSDEWGAGQLKRYEALVRLYAGPIRERPVNRITAEDIADMLRPIWNGPGSGPASRLRSLIELVLNAKSIEPNPASWSRMKSLLSKKSQKATPHASLPWQEAPALVKRLDDSPVQRAVRFIIITAARQQEALGATWGEIDLLARTWTIPAERMKMDDEHVVPLTNAAITCLGKPGKPNELLFISTWGGKINHDAPRRMLKDMAVGEITLHGFRATFATWAQEHGYDAKLIDFAIAHKERNKNRKAYQRSTRLLERRGMIDKWSTFVAANTIAGVHHRKRQKRPAGARNPTEKLT